MKFGSKTVVFTIFLLCGAFYHTSTQGMWVLKKGWEMLKTPFTSFFSSKPQLQEREKENVFEDLNLESITLGGNTIKPLYGSRYRGKPIVQLSVKCQFEDDGGGGASCAYQTLKNGIETILALDGKDVPEIFKKETSFEQWKEERPGHLKTSLKDPGLIHQLFGNYGPWRHLVMYGRTRDKLLAEMCNSWKSAVRSECCVDGLDSKKVCNFYAQVLTALAENIVTEVLDGNLSQIALKERIQKKAQQVCFLKSQNDVIDYYLDQSQKKNAQDLQAILCTNEVIERCVDLAKVVIPQAPDQYTVEWQWLDGTYMQNIIKHECKDGVLKDIQDTSYVVYEDIFLLGTEFDSNAVIIKDAVLSAIKSPGHKVLFCIGTMSNEDKRAGHWFSLVWTQERCYVMDSAGDIDRTHDDGVIKIMNMFESLINEEKLKQAEKLDKIKHTMGNNLMALCLHKTTCRPDVVIV